MVKKHRGGFQKASEKIRVANVTAANKRRAHENREKKARLSEVLAGRRIVELDSLAQSMWCNSCDIPLSLRFMEEETVVSCASILKIRCHQCLAMHEIHTSKKVNNSANGYSLYSSNVKAALGLLDSGLGVDPLIKFFSTMNLPVFHRNAEKRAEDYIGEHVIQTADESCKEAIVEERNLTIEQGGIVEPSTPIGSSTGPIDTPRKRPRSPNSAPTSPRRVTRTVGITVKYDYGWDKRGSGFKYDSHSGRGSIIGQLSEKLLGYEVLSSYCRKCALGFLPEDHACVRNHDGSAKSQEPRAAVKLILENPNLQEAQVRVEKFVGDKDASTMAALMRDSTHPIQKIVDINHNTKGINNKLYDLKKSKHKFLTSEAIDYLKRCVNKAIKQNKDNVDQVRAAIMNIVPHTFGEHDACGDWCTAKVNPSGHLYKNLPNMKPFSDANFRVDLQALLQNVADEADQLAPCGSSLQNESFNHMVVTRAPKSRHYAGTKALMYRVASTVCHKNLGADYIERVFQSAHLSPSVKGHRASVERRRQQKSQWQNRPEVKRRRLQLKFDGRWKQASYDSNGGLTYVSGMATVMERAVAATVAITDTPASSWIPPATILQPDCCFVIVDLETTGLAADAEIVQIAAKCGSEEFSAYMTPQQKISPYAAAVTGMQLIRGKLVQNGQALQTTPAPEVAAQFLSFLQRCGSQVVLVGHNIVRFDAPRIVRFMKMHGLVTECCSLVHGLVDTMPLIRQGDLRKQDLLAQKYLTGDEWQRHIKKAHDALSDCILLNGLLQHFNVSQDTMVSAILSMNEFMRRQVFNRRKALHSKELMALVEAGISKQMVGKMAGAGVTMEELDAEYRKHGRKGLEVCLGVQIHGAPRVTTNKSVINKMETFMEQQQHLHHQQQQQLQ